MKAKIAAIGEKDIMLIFKAIGVDIFPTSTIEEAGSKVDQLAKENYGIIFMTETIAEKLDLIIKKYANKIMPSIVVIPGLGEESQYAVKTLRQAIIKAVGADVMAEE